MKNRNQLSIEQSAHDERAERLEFEYPEGVTSEMVAEMAAARSRSYEPTGSFHEDGREQRLAVFTTTPKELKGPEVVVRFMPWSDEGDRPENAMYDALLSASTGRSVVTVNSPGVNRSAWIDETYRDLHKLTPDQREDLKEGSLKKVGGAIVRAAFYAEALSSENGDEEVLPALLMGSSMGASLVAGAVGEVAGSELGQRVHSAIMEETTNLQERSPYRDLGSNFLKVGGNAAEYLGSNPEQLKEVSENMLHWIGRVVGSRQANLAYFRTLAKGGFSEDLGNLDGFDAPIYIVNGSESKLSPSAWNDRAAEELEKSGANVERIEFEGDDHARTMNLQSTIDLVNHALAS